jgi:hypothetical protein
MPQKPIAELTDAELLQASKKMKSASIINALLIGFLVGVVFYSVVKNRWGLVTIIPMFLIYKLVNTKSGYNSQELESLLKERNLK